jgi:hypothetical protein
MGGSELALGVSREAWASEQEGGGRGGRAGWGRKRKRKEEEGRGRKRKEEEGRGKR